MSLAGRFVAYQPGTDTRLALLPEPTTAQVMVGHNAVGSLTLKYSRLALNGGTLLADAITAGLDVALEVSIDGGPWIEPANCRFVRVGRAGDPMDPAQYGDLQMPSYGWLYGKARNNNTTNLLPASSKYAGQRQFKTSNAGKILGTLLTEHTARGIGLPMLRDWTDTLDSAGVAWSSTGTRRFPLGVRLSEILDQLAAADWCDWRTQGRTMRMWNADGAFVDRATTVSLALYRDIIEAPSAETIEDLVHRLLVKGDDGAKVTVNAAGLPTPWGHWEGYVEAPGSDTTAEVTKVANAELADAGRLHGEYTRDLTLTGPFMPWRDYEPGDWVTGPTMTAADRMRVQTLVLRKDADGWGGSVTLNDKVGDKELARARKLAALVGSTSWTVYGTGQMAPEPDLRTPSAPAGPVFVAGDGIDREGNHYGTLTGSWSAVADATDGTSIVPSSYEILGQPTAPPASAGDWRLVAVTPGGVASVTTKPFPPGETWSFKVRARCITSPNPGVDSVTVPVTFPLDATPPPRAAAPIVTSQLGALYVVWSGLGALGETMPADFAACRIHASTNLAEGPTAGNLKGSLTARTGGGIFTLAGFAIGATVYVWLVTVDKTGNAAAASDVGSAMLKALVATELDVVLPGAIAYRDQGNLVVDGSFEDGRICGERTAAGENPGGWQTPTGLPAADVFHGAQVARLLGNGSGAARAMWLQRDSIADARNVPVLPDTKLYLAARFRAAAASGTAYLGLRYVDNAGAQISQTSHLVTTTAEAAGVWVLKEAVVQVPAGAAYLQVFVEAAGFASPASSAWFVDAVQARQVIGTQLIEDLAVTNAKIGSVSVDKLLAGEIQAGQYVSAGPVTGPHTALEPNGLFVYSVQPDTGVVQESISLGTGAGDVLRLRDADGEVVASIDGAGYGTFTGLEVTDRDAGFMVFGTPFLDYFTPGPKGLVAWKRATATLSVSSATEVVYTSTECRVMLEPDRSYRVEVSDFLADATVADCEAVLRIRYAAGGGAVGIGSTPLRECQDVRYTTNAARSAAFSGHLSTAGQATPLVEHRFIVTAARLSGSGTYSLVGGTDPLLNVRLAVYDEGPAVAEATAVIRYTSEWAASASTAYDQAGVRRATNIADNYVDLSEAPLTVGDCGSTTNSFSVAWFANSAVSGETTKTIAQAMSGATIEKVEVWLRCQYAEAAGGLDYYVRSHASTVVDPGTYTPPPTTSGGAVTVTNHATGASKWVNITSIWDAAKLGVVLGQGASGASDWHGHIRGATHTDRPKIRITYRR